MLPIVAIGAVALAGLLLEGCGGGHPNDDGDASRSDTLPAPQNSAPMLSVPNSSNFFRETNNELTITASDPDGDNIDLSMSGNPPSSSLRITENRPGFIRGIFSWMSACSYNANQARVTFRAVDRRGGENSENVSLTLRNMIVSGGGVYNINRDLSFCRGTYSDIALNVTGNNVSIHGNGATINPGEGSAIRALLGSMISAQGRSNLVIEGFNLGNNNVRGAAGAISLRNCYDFTVANSTFISSRIYNSRINGNAAVLIEQGSNGRLINLTVNSEGARYLATDTSVGLLFLNGANNMTIRNCIINGNGYYQGITLQGGSNTLISDSEVSGNADGIALFSSNRNTISGCNIHDNVLLGVYLSATYGTTLTSSNNIIANNTFSNNRMGAINTTSSGNVAIGNTYR